MFIGSGNLPICHPKIRHCVARYSISQAQSGELTVTFNYDTKWRLLNAHWACRRV